MYHSAVFKGVLNEEIAHKHLNLKAFYLLSSIMLTERESAENLTYPIIFTAR